MEKVVKCVLLITTLISLYIIFCVGLGWFWTIGFSFDSDKINQILINLSYSYMAGFIFYILVSYLPYRLKTEKLKPVIKLKINDLYNQINACVQTFDSTENNDIIINLTVDKLAEKINNNNMYGNSFYAIMVGYQMNNLQFLKSTKDNVFGIISSILEYKEYMNTDQILNIEKIRDSEYFHLVKVYEDTPIAKTYYSSQQFKDAMIKDLYEIIVCVRELKKSVK